MNQILSFEEKGRLSSHMKKTVKTFSLLMIAFGIIITAEGGYSIAKNKKTKAEGITTIEEAEKIKPEISLEQNNSKLEVKIDGKEEISNITYRWSNDADEKELLAASGRKSYTGEIDVPNGTNELSIKVVYANAKNFPFEQKQTFTSNSTKIKLAVVQIDQNMKMKITVEDQTGIDNVAFRWNNDLETIKKPEVGEEKEMELITDIPFGENTLHVTAINKFGEKSEKSQQVKGTAKPEVNATLYADGKLVLFVTARDNIKNIEFTLNGEEFTLNFEEYLEQGYTVEDLKAVPGLTLETNEVGKILGVTYEYQTTEETNELEITAMTEYTSQTVGGTLKRPAE